VVEVGIVDVVVVVGVGPFEINCADRSGVSGFLMITSIALLLLV
jgi:hypothetical protein